VVSKDGFSIDLTLLVTGALSAPPLIIRTPDGVGPLRVAAGTSPVPLTAIAKQYIHAKHPLDAYFSSVSPTGPQFSILRHFNLIISVLLFVHTAPKAAYIGDLTRVQSYLSRDATKYSTDGVRRTVRPGHFG
jgi:hypothetical protein